MTIESGVAAAPLSKGERAKALWSSLSKRNKLAVGVVTAAALMAVLLLVSRATEGSGSLKSVIQTSSGNPTKDSLSAMHNEKLSSLKITKDMDAGSITIRFDMDENFTCPSCQFMVRLFDRNGNYLTHLTSEPFYQLFRSSENASGWQVPSEPVLEYAVNLRDLKEAEMAEFGVID